VNGLGRGDRQRKKASGNCHFVIRVGLRITISQRRKKCRPMAPKGLKTAFFDMKVLFCPVNMGGSSYLFHSIQTSHRDTEMSRHKEEC
jgi:hypothetical protein